MRTLSGFILALVAVPACAQVTGSVAVHSDYRHRGVSYSERDPAAQLTLVYDHPTGLFAGASATTVNIESHYTDTRLQALYHAGYVGALSDRWHGEVGVLRYTYPGSKSVPSWDYTEWYVGVLHDDSSLRVFQSPDYFAEGGRSWYVDAGHSVPLRGGLALTMHLGFLRLSHDYYNDVRHDANSRFDARIGVSYTRKQLRADVGVVGLSRMSDDCLGDGHLCRPGVVVSVTYLFP